MRLATILLIGAAVAGVTGLALAAGPAAHEMTIALPNGGTARIRYVGDVPPKVNFVQGPSSPFAMTAFGPGPFADAAPFAEIARIQALMDRQMAQMVSQARQMQRAAMTDPLYQASMGGQPSSGGTSFVSTLSGSNYCLKSVQITASPNGAAPKVVSHTEGNCGGSPAPQNRTSTSAQPSSSTGPLQTIASQPVRIPPRPHQAI